MLWLLSNGDSNFPKLIFHDVVLGSDHCPLIIHLNLPLNKVPKLFKFESMWLTHPDCKEVIASSWDCSPSGSHLFQLVQKQKSCRRRLIGWSKSEFGNNKQRLDSLKHKLALIQSSTPSISNDLEEKQIKGEIKLHLDYEEVYYNQRSRIKWLQFGDRNTSFFHATVIQRNQLLTLKNDNGSWLQSPSNINQHLGLFFHNLFQANGPRDMNDTLSVINHVISPSMNASLISPVSDDEIKSAAFQPGAFKAPGADVYPGIFYHSN